MYEALLAEQTPVPFEAPPAISLRPRTAPRRSPPCRRRATERRAAQGSPLSSWPRTWRPRSRCRWPPPSATSRSGTLEAAAPALNAPAQAHRAHRKAVVHSPDRLGAGAGSPGVPDDGNLAAPERQRCLQGGTRTRQSRPCRGRRAEGRHARPDGPGAQAGRYARLRRVPRGLRDPGGEGPPQPPDAGRFRRHHHDADQPRRTRHCRVGSAADARSGKHHRHRVDRLPGRIRGDGSRGPPAAWRDQGDDDDQHLRSSRHPGSRVRGATCDWSTSCSRESTGSTRRSPPRWA